MKPIIKWPGGKSEEIVRIQPLVPQFDRYHEPFLGGGAIFFHLEPKAAVVSDVNPDLVGLYRCIVHEHTDLTARLEALCAAWDASGTVGRAAGDAVHAGFAQLRTDAKRQTAEGLAQVGLALGGHDILLDRAEQGLGMGTPSRLSATVEKTLSAKLWRIHNSEVRTGAEWGAGDIADQVETAVRAGLYTWLRDVASPADDVGRAVRFFFLREFCYGAMFRLNKQGRFNIPYGGRSYNAKNLRAKIVHLLSDPVSELLGRATVLEGDFEEIFCPDLTRADFIFCDPPYDSEFSDYDGHPFGRAEQARLAEAFGLTDAKCLLVVQRTPFISELYARIADTSRHPVVIEEYGKNYSYNVKGRNEQSATHLAIRNYEV